MTAERTVYRVESIMPAPPGLRAVRCARRFDLEHREERWIELTSEPVIALATVTVYETRSGWLEPPTEEELDRAEVEVHGLVSDEGLTLALAARREFLGYLRPGERIELWLPEVKNPDGLPVVIPTPEQQREREDRWAEEARREHGVLDLSEVEPPPGITEGAADLDARSALADCASGGVQDGG